MHLSRIVIALILGLFTLNAFAANINPKGSKAFLGAGYATYKVTQPGQDFKLDSSSFYTLGGQKGFGTLNLYLTFGFNYIGSTGLTHYNYTTSSGDNYAVNDVKFNMNAMQASLGLKFIILDKYFIRPYIEGGGVGGYYTQEYKPTDVQKADLDADASARKEYKLKDSVLDFGSYVEAGLEIDMFDNLALGLKGAYRVQRSETKEVDTINKSKIAYTGDIFYLSVFKSF